MRKKFDHLPNWNFELDEISAGVYKVVGVHALGCSVEISGTDPDKLMMQALAEAKKVEDDLNREIKPENST